MMNDFGYKSPIFLHYSCFRLILHWNLVSISASSCIGRDSLSNIATNSAIIAGGGYASPFAARHYEPRQIRKEATVIIDVSAKYGWYGHH